MARRRFAALGVVGACLAGLVPWLALAGPGSLGEPTARLRRPVAAALLADGQTLCVANQRSGTISLVDLPKGRSRDEIAVGRHPTDLAVTPDRGQVLVVDDDQHELVALACDGTRLTVRARLPVGPYPVSVAVLPDGTRATVASLWSRRVEELHLPRVRVVHVVRLPFAPRLQCVLPDGRHVVVADAFGGHLAVVDAVAGRLVAVHTLTGHNLRGLALDGEGRTLRVAHQILNQQAPTTRENIERGVL